MDSHVTHSFFDRRPIPKSRSPPLAVKWFKEWVPQDLVSTGGKCLVLKWVNEVTLNAIKEKLKDPHGFEPEPEPEPTTEVLFLCSYEGCGKTFIDAGALRKHSHIHGERQHVCQYENCGKKFLDSSKLKRHYLIHTGERDYVCPQEGCGKAFSLDFNLRSHMKTHSQENYHVCPYPECGKRYAHEYKLKNHVASHHEKPTILDPPKYTPPAERPTKTSKASTGVSGPPSAERPHACPYDGCEKAYIHEYKLNLHLRREHPGHFPEDNHKNNDGENDGDGSDQDGYAATKHSGRNSKAQKSSRAKPSLKLPPSKAPNRRTAATNTNVPKKTWPVREVEAGEEEDSEETEEERDNPGNGWTHVEDDEETEYED